MGGEGGPGGPPRVIQTTDTAAPPDEASAPAAKGPQGRQDARSPRTRRSARQLHAVRLDRDELATAYKLGNGNLSEGIRLALRICKDHATHKTAAPARVTPADLLPVFDHLWHLRRHHTDRENTNWIASKLEGRGWRPGVAAEMAPRVLQLLTAKHGKGHP